MEFGEVTSTIIGLLPEGFLGARKLYSYFKSKREEEEIMRKRAFSSERITEMLQDERITEILQDFPNYDLTKEKNPTKNEKYCGKLR